LQQTASAIVQNLGPHYVAIAFHYGMRASELVRLSGVEGRVDPSEDNERSLLSGHFADLIAPQSVPSVNANANDVAGPD